MGKHEEEDPSFSLNITENNEISVTNRCHFCKILKLKCVFMLILAASLMLSALFLLPPFKSSDRSDLDLTNFKNYEIVATFMLGKPVSLIKDNISKLEDDIFYEIEAPTIKVKILYLIPSVDSNKTQVIFAVVPYDKHSEISATGLSLIRANFVSLVIRQYTLRLTSSLFGDPFSFDVLKFQGGITIIPEQGVFLLQKVQIEFNFTLNSSINKTQANLNALTKQLKSGLHLASYEILYIKLTNPKGSTVVTPTTVQSAVLLEIGTPSQARSKQLAQTITDSHEKNLGLNNTVFGKVKQVRLSSILQPSHGGTVSPTPAPSPLPHSHHHHYHHYHHHHHHHHHHHYHGEARLSPTVTPAPSPAYRSHVPKIRNSSFAPAPLPSRMTGYKANPPGYKANPPGYKANPPGYKANPPSYRANPPGYKANPPGCRFGPIERPCNRYHFVPPVQPPAYIELAPSPLEKIIPPVPISSPTQGLSPLPHPVSYHVQPPAQSEPDTSPLEMTPSILPSPLSSAGLRLAPPLWALPKLLVLVLLLL